MGLGLGSVRGGYEGKKNMLDETQRIRNFFKRENNSIVL